MEVPNELRHELLVLPNQVRFTDHNQDSRQVAASRGYGTER
jgi:hypothetical protein